MANFKLVSISNQVIYQKIMSKDNFCFMKFLKEFNRDTGMNESILNIRKSLDLINSDNNMSLKAILHVEDESLLRDIATNYGEKAGHYMVSVGSSEVAEKVVVEQPNLYDIVLLDKHLPGLDGDKFGLKLKRFSPEIMVCIVTGDPESINKEDIKSGIDRVIKKPLNYNIFCNTIGDRNNKVA